MSKISRILNQINRWQQRHSSTAFIFAVIKKYSDDEAGKQAALLTYYSFLALFPLLLIIITISKRILIHYPATEHSVLNSISHYFPVLGDQLSTHIHSINGNGYALAVGLLFTVYGARGTANAFIHGIQHVWHVPRDKRDPFPRSLFRSIGILIAGGIGFIGASILSGIASSAGHEFIFRIVSLFINVIILSVVFTLLIKLSLPNRIKFKEIRVGSIVAAIGLVLLQLFGGFILSRHLKGLDALYSYFAVTLGLLFWIYLQAQVVFYAIEVATVHSYGLWPRSMDNSKHTASDKILESDGYLK